MILSTIPHAIKLQVVINYLYLFNTCMKVVHQCSQEAHICMHNLHKNIYYNVWLVVFLLGVFQRAHFPLDLLMCPLANTTEMCPLESC